ncbi:DUF3267 domain-containing protein [Draconibacterium halophilum]|uniref:DUF3267 domain-containing protein n=1 Tax=Draconibacterium halophilum TaxID=2706887 RepID=A0A6C0R8R7_9BACT|nr:DUF3267 domain-containing protein [Draconibacterium halophilum]QIA06246.1 DUF3267 domain-containing protein [Draconibacterium halophilum]
MNRPNPSIETLKKGDNYELFAELEHDEIKSFVLSQLEKGGWLVKGFMLYQIFMVLFGLFIIARVLILSFKGLYAPLWYSIGTLIFCVTVLIIIHELLHGIALKLTGAEKVRYGAYLKKFIFYAEANRHVFNRKQFTWIAIAPLVVVKLITLAGVILFFNDPLIYTFLLIMCIHSLFCAGDIALLSVFYSTESEVFTFDIKEERKSYYFRKK